jgi:outer membrane protein assembly factor BamE (lipoprotein component of BamABCDE complex)
MKRLWAILLMVVSIASLMALAYMGFAFWSLESRPVSKRKMAQVHKRMHAEEVQKILGQPYKVYRTEAGGFRWIYGSRHQWYYFYVEFSSSSNVVRFAEDD